uniref:Uncharacterized protein n=1 Tax=Heterorhabditis bacteriophora TaxID=37862 RepID=A0A1I7XB80_HETBA
MYGIDYVGYSNLSGILSISLLKLGLRGFSLVCERNFLNSSGRVFLSRFYRYFQFRTMTWKLLIYSTNRLIWISPSPIVDVLSLSWLGEIVSVFPIFLFLYNASAPSLLITLGSRGDFHPRGPTYRRQRSAILSPGVRSPLPNSRYSCVFVIRWTSFDISPLMEKKRTFMPLSYQRLISVPWANVCDVRIHEKKQGTDSSWILTITWLPVLDDATISDVIGEDKMNIRHIAQLYESSNWKAVQVEMRSREEGLDASNQMMSMVQAMDTPAYQAFCHSSLGARRPHQAAEAALMEMAAGPLLPPPSPTKKKGKLRQLAKLSKTFTLSGD